MNYLHFIVSFVRSYAKKIHKPYFYGFGSRCLFYSFGLRALFCASHFTIRIRDDELNSTFSVRVFTGSARDALSGATHSITHSLNLSARTKKIGKRPPNGATKRTNGLRPTHFGRTIGSSLGAPGQPDPSARPPRLSDLAHLSVRKVTSRSLSILSPIKVLRLDLDLRPPARAPAAVAAPKPG
jgi:hypothetical protein